MAQVRVLIVRAPGTNCDQETAYAFEQAGAVAEVVHVNRLLESPAWSDQFQVVCFPGGFSYGDDVAAGRIVAVQLRHHLTDALTRFRDAGKLVLGICNGFQILIKSGLLLPDLPQQGAPATLTWNQSGRFEDRWVHLAVTSSKSVFLRGIERMYLPIAHAEGQFITHDAAVMAQLEEQGQLVLRYTPGDHSLPVTGAAHAGTLPFPVNPNGSQANVAGLCDATGRVFGLMPHPERHIDPTQHPQWTRRREQPVADGLQIFRNAVSYFA
jgi:phosphoribosylformylglycinamidine synthase I